MSRRVTDLETLARTDASVAVLARLQAVSLEAAEDPSWASGVPELAGPLSSPPSPHAPLLHDVTLTVDADRQRALLSRLASTLTSSGNSPAGALGALFAAPEFEPLTLLAASLTQDAAGIEAVASRAGLDAAVLGVVAHTATLPLLLACGRRAGRAIESRSWSHGYCPLCAAWPTLAEIRGLTRDFVLRCGRCASGWRLVQRGCPFCRSQDQQSQGYFAAEQERETRRAVVCDTCHGYLKTIATLGPLSISDVLLGDLQSLELDVTALEHEYGRPDSPGWELRVEVAPAVVGDRPSDRSWRRFWR